MMVQEAIAKSQGLRGSPGPGAAQPPPPPPPPAAAAAAPPPQPPVQPPAQPSVAGAGAAGGLAAAPAAAPVGRGAALLAGQLGTPAPQAYLFPASASPARAHGAVGGPAAAADGLQGEISQLWTAVSAIKAQASPAPAAAVTPAPPAASQKPVELSGFPDFLQMRKALKSCKRPSSRTPQGTPLEGTPAPPGSAPVAESRLPPSTSGGELRFGGPARPGSARRSLAMSLTPAGFGTTPFAAANDARLGAGAEASVPGGEVGLELGDAGAGAAVLGVENQRLRATLEHRAGDLRRALRDLHCSQRQVQDLSIALATLEEKLTVAQEQATAKDSRLREAEEHLARAEERYTVALGRAERAEEARRAAMSDLERLKMEQEPGERRVEALEERCNALAEQNRLLHREMQKVVASTEQQLRKAAAGAALAERGEKEAQAEVQETSRRAKRLERELKQTQKNLRSKSEAEQEVRVFGRNLTKTEVESARDKALKRGGVRGTAENSTPSMQVGPMPPAPLEAFNSPEPHTPRHNRERLQRRRDAANFAVKAELERTTQELTAMKSLRRPTPTRFVF